MIIRCPCCEKKTAWEENPFRPFCSERCRLMDLGKWASGEYRIEGGEKSSVGTENGENNDG